MGYAADHECEDAVVVMEPLPSFEDLVWLFGAEPRYTDAAGGLAADGLESWRYPWPYTSVKFLAVRGGYEIELDVEPGYGQVGLRMRAAAGGEDIVDLQLAGVRTVGVDRTKGRELLRIEFPEEAQAATLWLRLKPDVTLQWTYNATS
ncbi:hypothetical protein Dvina_16970 [Dactylosporangium vinaceum]|uniref:Uncharacterized protein n=1 Tax=Dactylosporangium vinaceum TaxID=53362 RepID=A0ABV5MKC1_9ACTN|nr:hypothetical protein [Dactylosporangium vinaceum]UAB99609.1 hypothetical protein Dvina_16970 [Dactylosporangium vinaceum]